MFKAVSFGQFTAHAARQGVAVDGVLLDRVIEATEEKLRRPTPNTLIDPKHMLTAIRVGARMLQTQPEHPLVSGRIELDGFGNDYLALALGRLVNRDHAPEGVVPLELPAATGQMSSCAKTETGFAKAFRSLVQNPVGASAQIIMDGDGRAVAVRKGKAHGVSSALTLVPTEAGDIYIPAGSVVRMDVAGDTPDDIGRPIVTNESPRVVPVDDITGVAYRRPTAFAMPADQRLAHFGPEPLPVVALNVESMAGMAQFALDQLQAPQSNAA
jgi:hypothetical protein